MSLFVGFRSVTVIEQTVLYLQGRDARRVLGAVVAAVLKLVLIAELAWLGPVGAGIACVIAEALLLAWFVRLARRHVLVLVSPSQNGISR
jgi:O-antigen/teichoic acid export membrane protein